MKGRYDWFYEGRLKSTGESVYRNTRTEEWAKEVDHKHLLHIDRPRPGELIRH